MFLNLECLSNLVGLIGVGLVTVAFFLTQVNKVTSTSSIYLYLNCIGSVMLLFSLYYSWNLSSVIIEILWLSISIYGIVVKKRASK